VNTEKATNDAERSAAAEEGTTTGAAAQPHSSWLARALNKPLAQPALELFLISLLALYFELLIIRWLSSEVRIFAYFKNMPLIASLFGLGTGLALTGSKRDFSKWFPPGLLLITVIISYAQLLNLVHVTFIDPREHYLLGWFNESAGKFLWGLAVLVGVFYLIVLPFLSLGQRLGRLLDQFEPLVAYSINVAGSLAGIALFSLVGYLSWKPHQWLILGVIPAVWFFRKSWQIVLLALTVVVACVTVQPQVLWSPYYRIHLEDWWIGADGKYPEFKYGTNINVNHDFLEGAWDNREEVLAKLSTAQRQQTYEHYTALYKLIGDKPRDILVLAAGAGNDVAMALRHGARSVDAVEIDPVIMNLGKQLNIERPYSDPRVGLIVDDGRAYLRRAERKYDLIEFAALDSHSAFSSMSSIRLDNYVYTVESFKDAIKLLKPDGIVSVVFCALRPWQAARVYKNLEIAAGYTPAGVWTRNFQSAIFFVGPGVNTIKFAGSGYVPFEKYTFQWYNSRDIPSWQSITPSTDDWPYLFLRKREVTLTYASGLLITLLIGFALIGKIFGRLAAQPTGLTMLFLGAGFMLVEVKCVSQMGLLLGTTWLVNSVTIAAVLLMILVANLIVMRTKEPNLHVCYVGVIISLLVGYFTPLSVFQSWPLIERSAAGSLVLSLPIMFAAPIFAATLRKANSPHAALGMNLLGSLIGGLLEYASMVVGLSALSLVAIALYGLAWLFTCTMPAQAKRPA